LGIRAGCWADTLVSEGSLRTDTIVCCSEDLWSRILWNRVLQYIDSVKTILFSRYYVSGAGNGKVTLCSWVVVLIPILSEALIILLLISPEVIKGFY